MARKFFYVCAGILMLALSYHFGATAATAQAVGVDGPAIAWVDNSIDGPIRVSGVVNRIFYVLRNSGASVSIPDPIPGTARVIASDPACTAVLLENGDVYSRSGGPGWTLMGNLYGGGPVPALHESWGSLKARYAPTGTVSKVADTK